MRILPFLFVGILAGCATSPAQNAKPVGASAYAEMQPGYGSVTVKRDSGFMGAACKHRVFADGAALGELSSSQQLTVYLPPGDHVFGVTAAGMCGGGTAETSVTLKGSDQKRLRIASGQSGDITIQPTAF